ncbi:sensor histidine kinase [Lachnoclostridium phytofermentans]|uniref:histidine kinase n=1 Tax=Lachnoclostridium phytofermentans (strain ATCC 700394 / DSM 18823 / ISDg) TaxID=357809 RepID=A9KP44_LACP7|nr:HAMP domain-containing sensor histidine kinase [Lachnoclostridium phytofermentans]ABX43214.1 integral membrane sensor signal transduction histidine kinase [Lachnoclostridium phytofermentans ISDg]
MKHSLRLKITFLLTISLALTIFLCWGLNKSFLTDYYQYSKIKSLDSVFYEVNNTFNESSQKGLTQEQLVMMDSMISKNNASAYISDMDLGLVYRSNGTDRDTQRVKKSMKAYLYGNTPDTLIDKIKWIKTVDNKYDIYIQHDALMQMNYIDLIGILDTGFIVFIRTNMENLQASSAISNNFLAYVGIFVTVVGTIVMYFISRSFTKPILVLENIAKKMSNLDFNAKYEGKSQDEIGQLGNSINMLSEKLEQTISELKVANIELQSDIEDKVQIDEMRKEFLSNVTHELKTPIALIQGYAEGLKDNISEDEQSREFYCEVIIDEAMKMNKMVKKLLSLNQLEFGNNQPEIIRFDIVSLINSVIQSTDILCKQKEIRIIFEEKQPCYVWADEYMIEEVVTNYVSNAINHADGAKIVEIKLIHMENVVRVAVFNTGELIPEEDLEKVWIKFYKVDKARTREYGGNGIGLSIVKAIMNAHNKECGVVNHSNGVEFWFELDITS